MISLQNSIWWSTLGAIVVALFVGSASQYDEGWFDSLVVSSLRPSSPYVFGVMWPIMYSTIAVAYALLARCSMPGRLSAMIWLNVNLATNLSWSCFFFGLRRIDLALIDSLVSLFSLLLCIHFCGKCQPLASKILVPYALWLWFAIYLVYVMYANN
jgi:benzodiazapine receptor